MEAYLFRKRITITPPNSRGTVLDQRGKDFTRASKLPMTGTGILAGSFPDGITSIEGEPTPAEVRVLYRPESGQPGDGAVVATTHSAPDGTWMVEGLNPDLKYDVVGRKAGFNDVIMADVSPYAEDIILLSGGFEVVKPDRNRLEGGINISGGVAPYSVSVVGTAPAGIQFAYLNGMVEVSGTTWEWGDFDFTLRVTDANGVWAETPVELFSVDGQWDKVVSLLHFDGDLVDETGRSWAGDMRFLSAEGEALGVLEQGRAAHTVANNFQWFAQDLTIEFKVTYSGFVTAQAGRGYTFSIGIPGTATNCTTNGFQLGVMAGGQLSATFWRTAPQGDEIHVSGLGVVQIGVDHDIAFVYEREGPDGPEIRLYVDGKRVHVGAVNLSNIWDSMNKSIIIGWQCPREGLSVSPGTIRGLRITKGVARYTEDFTPPKAPF